MKYLPPCALQLTALIGSLILLFPAGAKDPDKAPVIARGATVKLIRDEMLNLYEKPHRPGKKGEVFQVLDVRPNVKRIFLGVQDNGRLIALWVPIDAVTLSKSTGRTERIKKSDALFAGLIPTFKIKITEPEMAKLQQDPRAYVEVAIEEVGGKTHEHIGLKLKGSVGSFQPIDGRPGFSLHCEKFKGGERFHGLKRFQLNNCNQDGTALKELISGEMARKAGVPASRCTHALVSLNGRDLGIYVLKEGFTEDFLTAFFPKTDGHLYDGGFCAEIHREMELDRGDPMQQERLSELVKAINEPDQKKQGEQLTKTIEINAYLRYLALENILCHWDGYSFNKNNYRLYENPVTGRFHFILHGMDQMFNDANWSVRREPTAPVALALWRANRAQYDIELQDIYEKVIKPVDWAARTEEVGQRLLAALDPERAKDYQPNIAAARDHVANRINQIHKQMAGGSVLKNVAINGNADLGSSVWVAKAKNAEATEVILGGRRCLYLRATGEADASWRLILDTTPGKYRLQALMKVKQVKASAPGEGAGLRIADGSREGQSALTGDADWKKVQYDFESTGGEQTLIVELRAKSGEVWVERSSLKLLKLP